MSESAEGLRITEVQFKDGKAIGASKASSASRERALSQLERLRQHALEIPLGNDGGEEVARIDRFFDRQGLKTKPVKILTPEELPQYIEALETEGYNVDRMKGLSGAKKAVYLSDLGLIVAVRRPEYEKGNGAIQFQSIIAHEKAHSTSEYEDIVLEEGGNPHVVRSGFRTRDSKTGDSEKGIFFNEGFAEYMAAKFVREDLGLPNGVWKKFLSRLMTRRSTPLPLVYVWPVTEKGAISFMNGAYPAYAFELIAKKEPEFHSALIEAQKSVTGLRRVAQIIEKLKPGLYTELKSLRNNLADLKNGFTAVQTAIASNN